MTPSANYTVNGGPWADQYRDRWKWDKVTWGSHSVDCYPGGCPFRVYVRDGKIVREEQGGTLPVHPAGRSRHEPDGLPEGRLLGLHPLLRPTASRSR